MAFFRYYSDNPRDLDLGFYLFRGGMKPHGLGKERDEHLKDEALRKRALDASCNKLVKAF